MLNITIHQGNENQNHNEVLLTLLKMPIIKKTENKYCDNVGQRELSCTTERNVNWHRYYGKQYGGSSKN